MALDNSVANATWGISVIGPVQGIYHGYMTEIANDCMLADYDKANSHHPEIKLKNHHPEMKR